MQLNGSICETIRSSGADQELFISNILPVAPKQSTIDKTKTEASISKKTSTRTFKKRVFKFKKSFTKHGFVMANALLIVAVTGLVWVGHNRASAPASRAILSQNDNSGAEAPLDTLSSADIAANIARATSMPEVVAVSNQADSINAQVATATVEQSVVTKPQLVAGGSKSVTDIQAYVTVAGDTVTTIATKFGVTSDTIKWSNSLTGDTIAVGKTLQIPPLNGIIYKVSSGDTVDSLASKYSASKERLIAFNDIDETAGLTVGKTIVIPDGKQPAQIVVAARITSGSSFDSYGFVARYGGNGYTPGYCTYYSASRVAVPANWGNANTWDNYARNTPGWTVSSRPVAGAVAQTDNMSWWGHVAYVEEVSEDGATMRYSDMNGLAGYGRVGISGWVSVSTFQNYIYR